MKRPTRNRIKIQTDQWVIEKIRHYYRQGWTKSEIDDKFDNVPYELIINLSPSNYGEGVLGSKTEPYFEKESDYKYIPPTYKELSNSEKKIYRNGNTLEN